MRRVLHMAFVLILLMGTGCSMQVLRQEIPVSTNPMGAQIYVDGQFAGTTPGTVSLERTKDHIITLVKEDYRQEDVVIRRQYQQDRVLMKAVQSGLDSGLFFKDPRMGLQSGLGSLSAQEETGEAYVLVPSAVKVDLLPAGEVSPYRTSGAGVIMERGHFNCGHGGDMTRKPEGLVEVVEKLLP